MKNRKHPSTAEQRRREITTTTAIHERSVHWQPQWWHYIVGIIVTLFIAFEVYGPALNGEFLFDDSYLPFLIPQMAEAPLRAWLGVRPFLMFSYWLNYQSAGLDPYPYHLVNLLFHAGNAIFAYLIVRRILGVVNEKGVCRDILALFSGFLFLLHPVHTESVAYVASRSEAMSVFFFLAAFAVFLYRSDGEIGWGRAMAVLVLFGIACTVKEHTTVLPGLLILTDLYFRSDSGLLSGVKRNWRLYAPLFVCSLIGLFAVWRVLAVAQTAGFRVQEFTWYQYLFTQFRSIWLYIRLYVAPAGQNADYNWPVSHTLTEHGSVFGLIGLLILAFLAWRYRKQYPLASYGLVGFLLLLAPTSSIVPIRDVAAERRLYLPFICLLFISVDLLRRWRVSPVAMCAVLGMVCAAAGFATYQRNQVWGSAIALWQDTVRKSPDSGRAHFQLAYAQWQAGRCEEAAANYERTAKLQKPDYDLLIDWALALDCMQKPEDAVAKLREAAQITANAPVYSLIGMVYAKRNRSAEALDALAQAEKLDPRFEMTYLYRGNLYANTGNFPAAIAEYRRALEINPANQAAGQGLALVRKQLAQQERGRAR